MIRTISLLTLVLVPVSVLSTGLPSAVEAQNTVVIGGGSGAPSIDVAPAYGSDGRALPPISVHDQGRRLLFWGEKTANDGRITLRPPKGVAGEARNFATRPAAVPVTRLTPPPAPPAVPAAAPALPNVIAAPAAAPAPPAVPAAAPAPARAAARPPFPPLGSTPPPPPPISRQAAAPAPPPAPASAPPATPARAPVPAESRPTAALPPLGGKLESFTFEAGQERLSEAQRARLGTLARDVATRQGQLVLTAYASSGSGGRNEAQRIAFTRAMHARAQLIGERFPKGRIEVRSLGEARDGGARDRLDIILRQVRQ